ncbi:MAG TPA: NAD(P)/FAD-dependent oxidoreductase [Candidatus Saccharimonadia bacterium]|nr:NAD(P)/FAD-dependent oxidoreductase [Candidatus Saccharimonadia bacterium]
MAKEPLDCLVIGAGPAGLTAATYLARYRRNLLVIDGGSSRARWIPVSRNCPGFPNGIGGVALLEELREQAERHDVELVRGQVTALERSKGGGFVARLDGLDLRAQTVVLATGVVDVLPDMNGIEDAIRDGTVRLCAICDGFETDGKRTAVYGPASSVASHARFLRALCAKVTVVLPRGERLDDATCAELEADRVAVLDDVAGLTRVEGGVEATTGGGRRERFDALYPVLGAKSQSRLAVALGADCDENGELKVDAKLRTSVEGLYAIGDVVSAINQISVAFGHAAIAATAVHNALPPRRREG